MMPLKEYRTGDDILCKRVKGERSLSMYCVKCGSEIVDGRFCGNCGAPVVDVALQPVFEQTQQSFQQQVDYRTQPVYQQQYQGAGNPSLQNRADPSHASPSFTDRLHDYAGSTLFFIGILLFAAGGVASICVKPDLSSIIFLVLLAIPAIGFFLMYAASKAPKLPERTLSALVLFKVTAILNLVSSCLAVLSILFLSFSFIFNIFYDWAFFEPLSDFLRIIGLLMLPVAVIIAVFSIIYFKFTMDVLGGIKKGIALNTFNPLPRIRVFTVLTCIIVGLMVLLAATGATSLSMLDGFVNNIFYQLGGTETYSMVSIALSTIFTLVESAGVIICVVVLNRFNKSLAHFR
jgi:hypothetical protein